MIVALEKIGLNFWTEIEPNLHIDLSNLVIIDDIPSSFYFLRNSSSFKIYWVNYVFSLYLDQIYLFSESKKVN
jgi:hypothetical protein